MPSKARADELGAARHVAFVAAAFLLGEADRESLLHAVTSWRAARARLSEQAFSSPAAAEAAGGGGGTPLLDLPSSPAPRQEKRKTRRTPEERRAARAASETWLTAYGDAWEATYGGTPPWGQLARLFRPLEREHGTEVTLARWKAYLAVTGASFASPARFASTFGSWAEHALLRSSAPGSRNDPRPGEDVDAYIGRLAGGAKA